MPTVPFKVKCEDQESGPLGKPKLTQGKEYTVVREDDKQYFIVNDLGVSGGYRKSRFSMVGVKPVAAPALPAAPVASGFKVGDIATSKFNYTGKITYGKRYMIVSANPSYYSVIGDDGTQYTLSRDYFFTPTETVAASEANASYVVNSRKPSAPKSIINKENATMSNAKTPFDAIINAAKHGFQVAAANKSTDLALAGAQKIFNSEFLATEEGRQIAKMIVSGLGMYGTDPSVASKLPFQIPYPELVQAYCGWVMEASTRDFVEPKLEVISTKVQELTGVFMEMAKEAVKMGLAPAPEAPVTVPEFVSQETLAAVHVEEPVAIGARSAA